jgi:hypothetical protein
MHGCPHEPGSKGLCCQSPSNCTKVVRLTLARCIQGLYLLDAFPHPFAERCFFTSMNTSIHNPTSQVQRQRCPGALRSPRLLHPFTLQEQVGTLSSPRTTTYYYYPKRVNEPHIGPQYITVTRAPKRTYTEIQTPPATPPLTHSNTITPIIRSPSTPTIKMARGATVQKVGFATEIASYRPPRDDERSVMEHFARHSAKCDHCKDPYATYRADRKLCSRGQLYAKDVANYLYAKGGKPFSIVDRRNDERVQVEIPAGCEAVSSLVKAFDRGMKLSAPRVTIDQASGRDTIKKTVRVVSPHSPVSPSRRREYIVDDRPRRYNDDYETVEIRPYSSRNEKRERNTTYRDERTTRPRSTLYEGKGSLFPQDAEDRLRRQRLEREPVVIVAEPSQRYTVRR